MKKKLLIVAGIIIIIAIAISFYILGLKKNAVSQGDVKLEVKNQPVKNEDDLLPDADHPFAGDDFTIIPPNGWLQTHIPSTLVSYQNNNETYPKDSAADKINFKSYIAVSFDRTNGKSLDEIVELVKQQIQSVAPGIIFTYTTDGFIDDQPAKFIEADLSMQDVDFKVMAAIVFKGDKYFIISNNTTREKWTEYRDIFYAVTSSFKFKY